MIKVLRAEGGKGKPGADWNWCEGGELVTIPEFICDNKNCGCDRSFTGLKSRKATTRAVVRQMRMSRGAFIRAVERSAEKAGFTTSVRWMAGATLNRAERLETGTVVRVEWKDGEPVLVKA